MRRRLRIAALALLAATLASIAGCGGGSSSGTAEIRIPLGAGGVGFLPLLVMENAGFVDKLGRENVCPHIEAALNRSRQLLGLPPSPAGEAQKGTNVVAGDSLEPATRA